ncbi:MAG: hypothetical protein QOD06_2721 [Candidatus Binatota bacterium]|nr:hypothetical protein [Candidatus Binatota bacterium]
MSCAACGQENRPSAKFCDRCGVPLAARCNACAAELRPDAKFCDQCGGRVGSEPAGAAAPAAASRPPREIAGYTPRHLAEKILTSRSALEGERKQVTVLFADCVGFTALSARLDPEDLHELMDGCFRRLLDAVHRYEGTVNQFTGDGVMALFGAPIAHEDHAVRAVAAALTAQVGLAEYRQRLASERGLDLAVRIGLNTGPVVVGRIGDDLRMDYTAQGETVNLAARLQAVAPPGGVLLSSATHRLVDGYFRTEERGPFSLKGLDQPVPAYDVVGRRGRRTRFEVALERGLTPFVGRDRELAFLLDEFECARGGRGRVVSIAGNGGVGKSRLVHELRRSLGDRPHTYLESHCRPHGESLPFAPAAELVEALLEIAEGDDDSARAEKIDSGVRHLDAALEWTIPHVRHLFGLEADGAGGLDDAQRKRRMIEALKALILGAAGRGPLVLHVDDLQWADASSEEAFAALADGISSRPVLFVSSYRTGYVPPWQDRANHQRLAVSPLEPEHTSQMVHGLIGSATVAPGLRELVVERSEGNPLFAEELATYVRDREPSASARGETADDGAVPQTIQDLLTARIDRLPDALKRTLQVASVLGREFPRTLMEAVAPEASAAELDDLVRREILEEKELFPEVTYRFTHVLTRQVAYEGMLLRARADLHAAAGRALERLHASRIDDVVEQLAEHYARSGNPAKAIEYLLRAGDRASALFAHGEARVYYRRALALAGGAAASERRRISEKLGDAAFAAGALDDASERWAEALPLALEERDHRSAAALHTKLARACWAAGRRDDALSHLDAGIEVLGEDSSNLEAARSYQERGRVSLRLGDHSVAREWAERALALGERLGAADVVSDAYNTLGVGFARAGDIERGAEEVRRSLDTALANELGSAACRAYTNLAVIYAGFDHDRSAEYCRAGIALAERIGDRLQQSWLYCALAGGHCSVAGDYDEGIRAAESAADLDRELGQRNHLPIPLILLGQIHQCRTDLDASEQCYREALAVAESVGEPQMLFPCYEGLATLAIERGDDAGAAGWLEKSREAQRRTGWSSDTFMVLPFLC